MEDQTYEVRIPMPNQKPGNESHEGIRKRLKKIMVLMESSAFVCIIGVLIASLTEKRMENSTIWGRQIWKWCLLILSLLCGRLISFLSTKVIMSFIWKSNWVNPRVLYFAYGVRNSVVLVLWVLFVTLIWVFFFDKSDDITRGIIGCLIGAFLWLLKTVFIKVVGFGHGRKLLEKIKDAITLRNALPKISGKETGDCSNLEILKEGMEIIRGKRLVSLAIIDQNQDCLQITNGKEAKKAAHLIFQNLGAKEIELPGEEEPNNRPDATSERTPKKAWYLELEKLLQYLTNESFRKHFEERAEAIPAADNKENTEKLHIKRSVFKQWLVEAYGEYDSINAILSHSKTAIDNFDKIISLIMVFVIIIVWLLFMEYLTTKTLVFISGQFLLLGFVFGNTVKTVFEAVLFVFLIHPFDVADRCVVDGVQMVVDEMKILSTTFLRYDGEKIYYPNSVLASKPISNLYRSPPMGDSVEFAINLSTSTYSLKKLEARIKEYLTKNPRRWKEDHSVQYKEIEDVNKMKVALYVGHTVNFHYSAKRGKRRSLLVLEMKKIFEDLKIKYHLLPREVHLKYI